MPCFCFTNLQPVQFKAFMHPIRVVGSVSIPTEQLEQAKQRDRATSSRWPRRPRAELWTEDGCTESHASVLTVKESWNPQLIPHSSCIGINLHIFTYINTYTHTQKIFSTLNQSVDLIILNEKRWKTTLSVFLKQLIKATLFERLTNCPAPFSRHCQDFVWAAKHESLSACLGYPEHP